MTGEFRGTHLKVFDLDWDPHSIDRFAYYLNTKLLRFNSRIQVRIQARKELNHLLWTGKERTILFVRPFVLFRECNRKASGNFLLLCSTQLLFGSRFLLLALIFFCPGH